MSRMSTFEGECTQRNGHDGSVVTIWCVRSWAIWYGLINIQVNLEAQRVWVAIQNGRWRNEKIGWFLAAIYQEIPQDIILTSTKKDMTKDVWEMLKIMHMGFERVKEAKLQALRSEFDIILPKDRETVDDFLWDWILFWPVFNI